MPIMSSVSSRAAGAIVGSFIADAATLPVHWVYDQDELAAAVSKHPTPEFLPEMVSPFYRVPTGRNSAYGDHLYTLLKAVVESKGYDREAYKKGLVATFGPGSAYDYEKTGSPAQGPWLPGAMKQFLGNIAEGKEEAGSTTGKDMDCVVNTAVLVGLYAGSPDLLPKVAQMSKVVQNSDMPAKFSALAAKLLEGYVLNGPTPNAVEDLVGGATDPEVAQELKKALAAKDKPHAPTAKGLGYACSMPGNFLSTLHCLMNSDPAQFTESFRPTLLAGGDNCPRAAFIGACLGAQLGLEALPADLLAKVSRGQEVRSLAEQLVALRK